MFISAMDMTIVNVALPDISNDLDAGIGELQWVLDAFLVSLAGLLLVGNGLADRFGRRRVFLLGLIGFAVTSVLAAVAGTVGELIAARVLMGVAAACVMPPALSLLAVLFPPELRSKAAGVWAAVAGLGLALGPVLGGLLVDVAGWRWVFLVNVPFVLLAVPFGLRWLPESRRPGAPPLDIPGAALSTLALGGVVFTLIEGVDAGWTSPAVLIAAITGVAAGVAFLATELRRRHPLFDVRVLARRRVAAGALVILAAYIATLGMLFVHPAVRAVRPGRLGARVGSRGRSVRPRARPSRLDERAARREVRVGRASCSRVCSPRLPASCRCCSSRPTRRPRSCCSAPRSSVAASARWPRR